MGSSEEKPTGTIIDEICCILAERDKMIEGIMRGEVTRSDADAIVHTREGTAKLLYRLISDRTSHSNTYIHLHI